MPHRLILPLLLILAGNTSQADTVPLGRLFFDAQQRARLDQQRERTPWFSQQNTSDTEAGLTFSGEVRSSGGRRTRWINGEADWDNRNPPPHVPVGNTYYPESGQNDSLLGNGSIQVKPPRFAP